MNESVFVCPVCSKPLLMTEKSYICTEGHCFDIAKSGYVNLNISSSRGRHGDDKLMVNARTSFLNSGYYSNLKNRITDAVISLLPYGGTVLDAGCGEGYYSCAVKKAGNYNVIGIDLSKDALIAASKRNSNLILAVASTSSIPVADSSVDAVLNVFSPLFPNEFLRVLSDNGFLIRVIPLERHLWELKSLIYDRPYLNTVPDLELSGFELLDREDIKYSIVLTDNETISNLFAMTPYYYKTGQFDQAKISKAEYLETRVEFAVLKYRKK